MKLPFTGEYDTDTGALTMDVGGGDWNLIWPQLKPGFNCYTWQEDGQAFIRFGRGGQKPPAGATGWSLDKKGRV